MVIVQPLQEQQDLLVANAAADPAVYRNCLQYILTNIDILIGNMPIAMSSKRSYTQHAKTFLRFLYQEGGVKRETFSRYKNYLRGLDLAANSKKIKMEVARLLLIAAYEAGYMPINITKNVKPFQVANGHMKEGLNAEEVKRLLDCINRYPDAAHRSRYMAIAICLCTLGIRQDTLTRLRPEDVDIAKGTIALTDKGKEGRRVLPLPDVARLAFNEYEANWQNGKRHNIYWYFYANTNKSYNTDNGKLHAKSIGAMFTINPNFFAMADIAKGKTVHGIRHFVVTSLYEAFGDILQVCAWTGHSVGMVQRYVDTYLTRSQQQTAKKEMDNIIGNITNYQNEV